MKYGYILGAGLACCLGLAFCDSAMARDYPVCLQYGALHCEYDTYAQCQATASGAGGSCVDNLLYRAPRAEVPVKPKRRR